MRLKIFLGDPIWQPQFQTFALKRYLGFNGRDEEEGKVSIFHILKEQEELCVVTHTCNPSNGEVEAGGPAWATW